MKKKILLTSLLFLILITGCNNKKNILKEIEKKYDNLKSYTVTGNLEITNNDDTYNYLVKVNYKKKDNYKVDLVNNNNNYEQIIIRNSEGVYVITPSLNKSFKFQSDWPYNTSQIYLINSIIKDIKNDSNRTLTSDNNKYIYNIKANYPNNKKIVNQIIEFDKNYNIKNIKLVTEDGKIQMKMEFKTIDLNPNIDLRTFDISNFVKNIVEEKIKETGNLIDTIYPLYIPTGTVLESSEKVNTSDKERIIMTFSGEKPFILVEEVSNINDDFQIIPTYGEPFLLSDTVAALTDTSLTWSSNGIDYYLVSDVMSTNEIVDIARSIVSIPVMK